MVNIEFNDVVLKNNRKITASFSSSNITVVLGRNGIGKTTFLKSLLGLEAIKSGRILVDNIEYEKLSYNDLSNYFSYVPQKFIINTQLTVEQVINLGSINVINPFRHLFSKYTEESNNTPLYLSTDLILKELGIYHLKDVLVTNLSGGEQAIVNIARALRQNSKFLLIDEGDANLDIKKQFEYWKVINRLSLFYKKGIIVVSHDPNIVFNLDSSVRILAFFNERENNDTENLYYLEQLTSEFFSRVYGINMKVEELDNKKIVYIK